MGAPTRTMVLLNEAQRIRLSRMAWIIVLVLAAAAVARDTENALGSNEIADEPQRHQMSDLAGGEIGGERLLRRSDSPYLLRSDLEVAVGGKLIVEPGVTVHVAPMVGITVYGAMVATVSQCFSAF